EYCLNKTRNGKVDRRNAIEVIIVGAGVVGSALAYTLGKEGRRVSVIERDLNQPDRIVGELLQLEGYLKLLELDCVHKIDVQRVFSYVLYKNGKNTRLSYTFKHFQSDVAGRSFHNGRFIQRMRHKAASLPKLMFPSYFVNLVLENCELLLVSKAVSKQILLCLMSKP
ncbi:hypothetical protein Golob_022037, partial [Gossypium lobatum]|nr:hypothetical protein [Gossypium lobatum]